MKSLQVNLRLTLLQAILTIWSLGVHLTLIVATRILVDVALQVLGTD